MASWQFIYASRLSFYPPDYEDPGIGGSEAVLIVLAQSLARSGHDVTVYNCCYRPGVYDGVTWRLLYELDDAPTPDVRVAVRSAESVTAARQGRNVFWMLDDRPEGATYFLENMSGDGTVVVASRAMQNVLSSAGVDHPSRLIPHPIETHLYPQVGREPRPPICLYTSIPDRGLDIALTIWPRIRSAVPDAELHITSGYELWGFTRAEAGVLNRRVAEAAQDLAGVHYLGVVNRDQLRAMQSRSAVLLYPCREQEMFCLAVAEAAAAGTPAITTDAHALTERVRDGVTGVLINGCIDEPDVQDRFVDNTIRLLSDPALRHKMGAQAQQDVLHIDAADVARQWESIILA